MAILSAGMISLGWLILLGILLIIEIITLGLTTIWFAGGALIAFLVAILGGAVWLQVVVFLAVSILLLLFTNCNEVHEQKCTENQCGQSERGKSSGHSNHR